MQPNTAPCRAAVAGMNEGHLVSTCVLGASHCLVFTSSPLCVTGDADVPAAPSLSKVCLLLPVRAVGLVAAQVGGCEGVCIADLCMRPDLA